jgi:hypothetical protein
MPIIKSLTIIIFEYEVFLPEMSVIKTKCGQQIAVKSIQTEL